MMNTFSMRYEYLCNKQLKNMLSRVSFEKENCVENVHGFRFAKFITDRQKILVRLNREKNYLSKRVKDR